MLTHGNVLGEQRGAPARVAVDPEDRLVLALPLFHMHGLGVGLHGTLLCGGVGGAPPALRSGRGARRRARARRHAVLRRARRCTRAWPHGARRGARRAAAVRVGIGAAARRPARRSPTRAGIRVLERYGMTETLMNVSNPYDGERRAGTVGFPLPGVEMRLGDATARSCCAGPTCSPATGDATRRRARRSPTTAGSAPATSVRSTTTATSASSAEQGAHHLRWVQRVPPRGRGRAARAPGGRRGGGGRQAVGRVGRGRRRGRRRRRSRGLEPTRCSTSPPSSWRRQATPPGALRRRVPRNALGKVLRHEL